MYQGTADRPVRVVPRPALLLLAGVLSLGGCTWLSNYEKEMTSEQERVAHFDEQTQYLDAPVQIPLKKEPDASKPPDAGADASKEVSLPEIFFRPPRGILSIPDKNPAPASFFRYVRDAQHYGTKDTQTWVYTDVYVAVAPLEQQKEFMGNAVRAFASQLADIRPVALTETPFQREPLVFDAYKPPTPGFSLYFTRRGGVIVAIAFQLDAEKIPPVVVVEGKENAPSKTVTDVSLQSLGVGGEAAALRRDYGTQARYR